jgi:hypothetical protein
MQAMKLRRPRWSRPNKKTKLRSTTMPTPIYPQSAYRRFPIQGFTAQPNRRRRRWPMIVLSFILGLLAGWAIRGGGAWLP